MSLFKCACCGKESNFLKMPEIRLWKPGEQNYVKDICLDCYDKIINDYPFLKSRL